MLHLSELIIYKKYAGKYFKTIENHSPSKKKKKKKYIYVNVSLLVTEISKYWRQVCL